MKKIFRIFTFTFLAVIVSYYFLSKTDIIDVDSNPVYNQFKFDQRLLHPENFSGVSLSVIKTATADSRVGLVVGGESLFKPFKVSHNAILIRHPRGNVLFDTGLGDHIKQQFKDVPAVLRPLLTYSMIKSAKSTLAQAHVDIAKIILSHLHWDHASGIKDFPTAEILSSKLGYTRAQQGKDGAIKSQISGADIHWDPITFTHRPYENFDQSYDVYGDGSLIVVPLPGHTLGSVGLFVNTASGKRYFLVGDAAYSTLGFIKPAEKSFLLKTLIDSDHNLLKQTLLKIYYLHHQYPNLIIVPAHDAALQATLPQFSGGHNK